MFSNISKDLSLSGERGTCCSPFVSWSAKSINMDECVSLTAGDLKKIKLRGEILSSLYVRL